MTAARIVGIVILAAGVVLLIMGLQASDAFGEQVREELTGEYTEETQWKLYGGIAALVVGAGLTLFGGRLKSKG
jgi:hypothetical protein